jgi:hypothetical protein
MLIDPRVDGDPVEVEPLSPLDERDATLGDETADVADGDPEVIRNPLDVEERVTG